MNSCVCVCVSIAFLWHRTSTTLCVCLCIVTLCHMKHMANAELFLAPSYGGHIENKRFTLNIDLVFSCFVCLLLEMTNIQS